MKKFYIILILAIIAKLSNSQKYTEVRNDLRVTKNSNVTTLTQNGVFNFNTNQTHFLFNRKFEATNYFKLDSALSTVKIHYQAGNANTTGLRNVFLGYQAGYNSVGNDNINIGYQAGYTNSSGNCISIGSFAGQSNSIYTIKIGQYAGTSSTGGYSTYIGWNNGKTGTGNYNTYIGHAIAANATSTTAYSNNIIGTNSLSKITSGYYNCGLGESIFNNLTSGYNNIQLGSGGDSLKTGHDNIYIGHQSGIGFTGNYKLAIGSNTLGNLPMIYGEFDNKIMRFNAALTIVDTLTLNKNLYLLNTTSANPYGIIYKETDLFIHNFQHSTGLSAIPVGQNTFVGLKSGNLSTGSTATSTAMASFNSAFGYNSLANVSTGNSNTAIGNSALNSLTTINQNTGVGVYSLYKLVTGGACTAVGNSSGIYYGSGGADLTSSTAGTYLGSSTRASGLGLTNEISIGYNTIGNGSNTVAIGNGVTLWSISNNLSNVTPGANLTIKAGSAYAGGTADQNGGLLVLSPGNSKGTGLTSLRLQRNSRSNTTSTNLNNLSDAFIITSEKNLTNNSAISLFDVSLTNGSGAGGLIAFSVVVNDGTNTQVHTGLVNYAATNKAGVYTVQVTDETVTDDANALDSGTLTDTWSYTTGTNKFTITANFNSSLTPTSMKLYYTITNNSISTITQL